MPGWSRTRIAWLLATLVLVVLLLPVGARLAAQHWHSDTLWPNTLRSLGGLDVPYDFSVFLSAAEAVRHGDSPYVDPSSVQAGGPAPYVYPPLLALLVLPFSVLPHELAGSSVPGMVFSLLLIGCIVGALLALDVRDWRCYPVALLYPPSLENVELGAIGPILTLLVLWLGATRRWRSAAVAAATAFALALGSWLVVGFAGLTDYPALVRKLSDLEATSSYSAFADLHALGVPERAAQVLTFALGAALLVLSWRVARTDARDGDRRSLTLVLAAALVLTPILWLHYLVLLVVPVALARPRLSGLWFVPLAMTVFEILDWYRGWPDGEGRSLASVALVVALVFALALRRLPEGPADPRAAPVRA